jgi:hypothetical protein
MKVVDGVLYLNKHDMNKISKDTEKYSIIDAFALRLMDFRIDIQTIDNIQNVDTKDSNDESKELVYEINKQLKSFREQELKGFKYIQNDKKFSFTK